MKQRSVNTIQNEREDNGQHAITSYSVCDAEWG